MGQRIYRINPPDVEGDVFDADDAARLVGAGLYARRRPVAATAQPSRSKTGDRRSPADRLPQAGNQED